MTNPKTWPQDNRRLVWTVSLDNSSLYCMYVHSILTHENLAFDDFYPLYKSIVASSVT
jgi:hypothetical protein